MDLRCRSTLSLVHRSAPGGAWAHPGPWPPGTRRSGESRGRGTAPRPLTQPDVSQNDGHDDDDSDDGKDAVHGVPPLRLSAHIPSATRPPALGGHLHASRPTVACPVDLGPSRLPAWRRFVLHRGRCWAAVPFPYGGACQPGARPSPVARCPNQSTERSGPAERHHRPKVPLEGGPRSNRRPRGRRLHSGRDGLCQGEPSSRRPQDGVPARAAPIRLRCARVLTVTGTGPHRVRQGDWIDRCSNLPRSGPKGSVTCPARLEA